MKGEAGHKIQETEAVELIMNYENYESPDQHFETKDLKRPAAGHFSKPNKEVEDHNVGINDTEEFIQKLGSNGTSSELPMKSKDSDFKPKIHKRDNKTASEMQNVETKNLNEPTTDHFLKQKEEMEDDNAGSNGKKEFIHKSGKKDTLGSNVNSSEQPVESKDSDFNLQIHMRDNEIVSEIKKLKQSI